MIGASEEGSDDDRLPKHDLPLIRTLARGWRWYEELTSALSD
jgi:hypothetical protein